MTPTTTYNARRTEPVLNRVVDSADLLYATVKAYNTRQVGRIYGSNEADAMFDAIKLYNARRHAA